MSLSVQNRPDETDVVQHISAVPVERIFVHKKNLSKLQIPIKPSKPEMAGRGPNWELYQQEHDSMYLIYKSVNVGIAFLENQIGIIVIQVEHFREEDGGDHGHALFAANSPLLPRELRRIFWRNQPNTNTHCNHGSLTGFDTIACPRCCSYLKIIPISG